MAEQNTSTKVCKICNIEKDLGLFHKTPSTKDGRFGSCKECDQKKQHSRYLLKRDEIRKKASEKLKSNPEKLKQKIESLKQWRIDNPDKAKIGDARRNKAKYAKNKAQYLKDNKEWREQNKEYIFKKRYENRYKTKAQSANWQANKRGQSYRITAEQLEDLHKIQNFKCKLCAININEYFEVDHILAFSRNGLNVIENIHLTCASCNLKKSTKTLSQLRREKIFKMCSICKQDRMIKSFSSNKIYCRICAAKVSKEWRDSNPIEYKEIAKRSREKNREQLRLGAIEYRKRLKEK